ncbi:MAG: C69 family dipeptidase, partial [Candidatus Eisenbacteria sp.]|nr:C69 family dipeptidase [Candidatus Eisenbacteria bacterium]
MKLTLPITVLLVLTLVLGGTSAAHACSSLLVTKGASRDGAVMITYTCDGEFHPHLHFTPAADHDAPDSLTIKHWDGTVRGRVEQVEHTYAVVGLINEHQLAIGETTFGGREELQNPEGVLYYWDMMRLALQRARTAREAIAVMTDLVAEYGYASTGESFSIGDTQEAWIMEMIGPGPGGRGAAWVALRIPDGRISFHANKARIGEFPLSDPDNCLYSDNVMALAIERGYYDPHSGEPFRFCEAYDPATPRNRRYGDARVWSAFRRAAPSLNLSAAYHRGAADAQPYPLWIKPDARLSLAEVFHLMRDHYEGTPYDMTRGIDAGPYGTPNRWRPMTWEVDSTEYVWERPISTQQTAYSFVSQSRGDLPDAVGGVLWYGVDDTYFTCYVPLYCGIDAIPHSYTVGRRSCFSWDSAWWVF